MTQAAPTRQEFVAVNIAWSGQVARFRRDVSLLWIHEEYSLFVIGHMSRQRMVDRDVANFLRDGFKQGSPPQFFKHDLSARFTSPAVQSVLREFQVIPLTPPWNTRSANQRVKLRSWLNGWLSDYLKRKSSRSAVVEEIRRAIHDVNHVCPFLMFGARTLEEVAKSGPKVTHDRRKIYARWEQLSQEFQASHTEREARRLAAQAVLEEWKLIGPAKRWEKKW